MKDQKLIKGEELERINDELFNSFNPEDESWLVGGGKTSTSWITYSPSGVDAVFDIDINFAEMENAS